MGDRPRPPSVRVATVLPWWQPPARWGKLTVMRTLADILKQARGLSTDERRRLVEEIEGDLGQESGDETSWLAAMDAFLALGGTGHSDYTDVSSDKYKHLAEIYADKHE